MLNGSTVSLAVAALAVADAENLVRHADLGLALSLEAMRGEKDAFDPALHATRPHRRPGVGCAKCHGNGWTIQAHDPSRTAI